MTASTTSTQPSGVIAPYGGTLVDLMVPEADRAACESVGNNAPRMLRPQRL
jgi:hypothetical protein